MEVIGSNNHLKDSKTSSGDSIYNCHYPRDMNLGVNSPGARRKGEADIGLLVACKVQLSSEVIKWKTENLRLMKELDSVTHHTDDLKATVSKLAERTKELEERLTLAETENLQLKHRNAAMDEEKAAIVQRISMGFDKYHSFPYSESPKSQRLSREGLKLQRSFNHPVEDYIQVSHTLIDKMNREIQEFRILSSQYKVKDDAETPSAREPAPSRTVDLQCKEPCDAELEGTVVDLMSDTKALKQALLDQRRKLQKLMQFCTNSDEQTTANPSENNEMHRSPHHIKISTGRANGDSVPHNKYSVTPNKFSNSLRKDVLNTAVEGASRVPPCLPETQHTLSHSNATQCQESEAEGASNPDHRICPICEEPFKDKTQKEFEEHVLNHLERESASLLDQYVVI